MRGMISALSANYFSLLIGILVALSLIPFLLNRLGGELTGIYLLFTTISNFAAVGIGWLAGAGVKLIAAADTAKGTRYAADVHWAVFLGFLTYSVFFLFLTVLGSFGIGHWWISEALPETIAQARMACILLGGYVLISYLHSADLSMLTATLRQGRANLYRAAAQSLFAVMALGVMQISPRIDLLMLAQALSVLIPALVARHQLHKEGLIGSWRWRLPGREIIRQMIVTVGGPFFLFGLAQFVLMYADVFITGMVLGPKAVAAYVVLWKIAEFASTILGRVSETLSPYFTRLDARGESARILSLFLATSRIQHWLGILAGVSYALFGPVLVGLWVGPQHRPEHEWMYILAGLALTLQVLNRHDVILHFALGRVGRLIVAHVLEVSAKIVIALVLFPYIGIAAPLSAYVIVQAMGMGWWYRKAGIYLAGATIPNWWREVGAPAGAMLLTGGGIWLLLHGNTMNWAPNEILLPTLGLALASLVVAWVYEFRLAGLPLRTLPETLRNC